MRFGVALLLTVIGGCSSRSELWTKGQVIAAYDGPIAQEIWWPKEVASNQFIMIRWDGKHLKHDL
jgi:hypothetical protein